MSDESDLLYLDLAETLGRLVNWIDRHADADTDTYATYLEHDCQEFLKEVLKGYGNARRLGGPTALDVAGHLIVLVDLLYAPHFLLRGDREMKGMATFEEYKREFRKAYDLCLPQLVLLRGKLIAESTFSRDSKKKVPSSENPREYSSERQARDVLKLLQKVFSDSSLTVTEAAEFLAEGHKRLLGLSTESNSECGQTQFLTQADVARLLEQKKSVPVDKAGRQRVSEAVKMGNLSSTELEGKKGIKLGDALVWIENQPPYQPKDPEHYYL